MSSRLFLHVARSIYTDPGYSCVRMADFGATEADETAWRMLFMHDVDFLMDPTRGFWNVAPKDSLDANDNRVWALLVAHAMRQTGDL